MDLLASYGDSSSEEDICDPWASSRVSMKRCLREDDTCRVEAESGRAIKRRSSREKPGCGTQKPIHDKNEDCILVAKLPSPFGGLPLQSSTAVVDDPSLHDGRVRSFPHEKGNWASHVYIKWPVTDTWRAITENLTYHCSDLNLKTFEEGHVSVSKTLVLLHHWLDGLLSTMKKSVSHIQKFSLVTGDVEIYVNDEKTRTFVGLTVFPEKVLKTVVGVVDSVLAEYNLEPYYDNPSFHVSIGWALGDVSEKLKSRLPLLRSAACQQQSCVADHICLKTGHMVHVCPLQL